MVWILKKILLAFVWIYQQMISPLKPATCRFAPTCSEYAKQAILKHGPAKGGKLALIRISKCHPWGKSGYDPVP